MPDGSSSDWQTMPKERVISVDDAIAELEAGAFHVDTTVDLGDGVFVAISAPEESTGLLQRLRGHRFLVALANGSGQRPVAAATTRVDPDAKLLLDAVRKTR